MIPIYWCAGLGELFDRNTGAILERGTVNALMAGAHSTASTVNCSASDCQGNTFGHAYVNECNVCSLGIDQACMVTGISLDASNELEVYPNPVEDLMYLDKPTEWTLLNSLGQVVIKGKGHIVDFKNLRAGIYYLDAKSKVHRIVKN